LWSSFGILTAFELVKLTVWILGDNIYAINIHNYIYVPLYINIHICKDIHKHITVKKIIHWRLRYNCLNLSYIHTITYIHTYMYMWCSQEVFTLCSNSFSCPGMGALIGVLSSLSSIFSLWLKISFSVTIYTLNKYRKMFDAPAGASNYCLVQEYKLTRDVRSICSLNWNCYLFIQQWTNCKHMPIFK
jgi:hypothetical protein